MENIYSCPGYNDLIVFYSFLIRLAMDVPSITLSNYADDVEEEALRSESVLFSGSSTATSLATSGDEDVKDENALSDCERFMKHHVSLLFDPTKEINSDDKHTFGEFCQTAEGRRAFAKYVDNFRSQSLQVSETTYYKLAHSFALVLFECNEADDFLPAKSLMNMSFTYYHYPVGSALQFKHNSNFTLELRSPDMREFANHLSESEEDSDSSKSCASESQKKTERKRNGADRKYNGLDSPSNPEKSIWASANDWLSKEKATLKQFFTDFPGAVKQSKNKDEGEHDPYLGKVDNHASNGSLPNGALSSTERSSSLEKDASQTEKIYIYQALRYQPIWQSLRFWNAAFFDAVNTERQLHCSKMQWNCLSYEEKESATELFKNLTFAHLGSFIVNMKHLGISKETCLQFLRKQSVIGNLDKQLYQLLKTQIEMPLQSTHEA